jgi:hypothetical protein
MKKSITIFALWAAGLFAAPSGQAPADSPPPAPAKKKPSKAVASKKPSGPVAQPLTLPADAVQNPDGTYAYTDKAGKKWTYSKTPFGVMRSEDSGNAAATAAPSQSWNKVTDNGDTVTFERETPFGPIKTEKKKSELTEEERSTVERQTAKPR